MQHIFFAFILSLLVSTSIAQSWPVAPPLGQDAPDWMQKLASDDPNLFDIQREYRDYYRVNPFVKNTYTQFYKRFMRWARPYVKGDGHIAVPTPAEEAARERAIRQSRIGTSRTANWTYAGPKETWHTDGSTKVTWQTNIYSLDIAPSNASILYAGGESGGLWKTTDKGLN